MPHADILDKHRQNAKAMRREMTDAERRLWGELRAHRLMGLSFRRQMPIAGYIGDFTCLDHRLLVEVDGAQHNEAGNLDYDRIRAARLQADGWVVIRFTNGEVIRSVDDVCAAIVRTIGLGAFE